MGRSLIDMLINNLLCIRASYALSDKSRDIKYVKEIDKLIYELQKIKVKFNKDMDRLIDELRDELRERF